MEKEGDTIFLTEYNSYYENRDSIYNINDNYNYSYLLKECEIIHFAPEISELSLIGTKATRCNNKTLDDSHFSNNLKCEFFHINNINLLRDEFKNKGVMTIVMCDILLAILDREMAWFNNIEVSLVDNSKVLIDDNTNTLVSVYSRIFRGYKKGIDTSTDRLVVEGSHMYYLFPVKTRRDDIKYYQELRREKYETFKNSVIKKQ